MSRRYNFDRDGRLIRGQAVPAGAAMHIWRRPSGPAQVRMCSMASFLALANALESLDSSLDKWAGATDVDDVDSHNQNAKEFVRDVLSELKLARMDGTYELNADERLRLESCQEAVDGVFAALQAYGGAIGAPQEGMPSGFNYPTTKSTVDLYELRRQKLKSTEA